MIKPILSTKRLSCNRIFKCIYAVMITVIILGVSLEVQSPKNWEYTTEKTGTIRRIIRKESWIVELTKWLLRRWLGQVALVSIVLYCSGLFGAGLLWLLCCLTTRKILVVSALRSPFGQWSTTISKCAYCFGVIALPGALFLSLLTPLEATATASLAQATLGTGQAISALTANHLLGGQRERAYPFINGNRYKINIEAQLIMYQKLIEDPEISSKQLLVSICDIKIEITISQVNRIRKDWGLSARKGRPRCKNSKQENQPLITTASQPNAGLKLFLLYLDKNNKYDETLRAIHLAIAVYKHACDDEDFRLLHAREETIEEKWQALTLLSLAGIKRLSELDYKEHHLDSVLGFNYGYSTLSQFLTDLERIDAGYFLNLSLALDASGEYCYIDTHKIPYYSQKKMTKGMITSKNKAMAGSCAVLAHDHEAQAISIDYYPPDTHLTHVIEKACAHINEVTGISSFIVDREINSAKTARLFIANGWDLICLLAANEYKGLESFKKHFCTELEDGTRLYKATWKEEREDDPRKFILAQKEGHLIVYWVTPGLFKRLTGEQSVNTYCNRTEIQENSIKDMKLHGALDVNFGRKTVSGPDRTHQRKIDKVDEKIKKQKAKLEKAQQNIVVQENKVIQSVLKGHGALLRTRQNNLVQCQAKEREIKKQVQAIEQQKKNLGTPGQREDRDFRKQHIMSFRTGWLDNKLKKFKDLLSQDLDKLVDIETILSLFFQRTATVIETRDMLLYRFKPDKLPPKFRIILKKLIDGFNRISLSHNGKQVIAEFVGFT